MQKNPFRITVMTSLCVSVVAYFVLFFLLRADIVDTRSSVMSSLQWQQATLAKKLDSTLSVVQEAIVSHISGALQSVVHITVTKHIPFSSAPKTGSSVNQQTDLWWGNGIIISQSGLIITNTHVVSDTGASYTVTTQDGHVFVVKNVWFDPLLDVAILQADISWWLVSARFVPFATPPSLGQFAISFHFLMPELAPSISLGIITTKNKELYVKGSMLYAWLLQTDAAINPGDSWWPLLDIYGRVVGMITAIDQYIPNEWYALPLTQEFIDRTIESISAHQKIVRPSLGIVYTDISPIVSEKMRLSVVQHGIYLQNVISDSPAAKAGLLAGDIVVSFDDTPIDTQQSFLYQLYTYTAWETIRFHILRNGDSLYKDVVIQ